MDVLEGLNELEELDISADERLHKCMEYMRLDPQDQTEKALVRSLYKASIIYLRNAGVERPKADTPALDHELYDLATWGLTLYYYDHRDAVGNETAFPIGLRPIINQLKLEAEVSRIALQ